MLPFTLRGRKATVTFDLTIFIASFDNSHDMYSSKYDKSNVIRILNSFPSFSMLSG